METAGQQRPLTKIVAGPRLKYLGLSVVLSWHYSLWFVPNTFPGASLFDNRVNYSWMSALISSVVTVAVAASIIGRNKHLPKSGWLIWGMAGLGSVGTLVIVLSTSLGTNMVPGYFGGGAVGTSAGMLWLLWGERYARQRARFTLSRMAPTYGVTLIASLACAYFLPLWAAPVFVAVLPLISGWLLWLSWRRGPVMSNPPMLPRQVARHGFRSIVMVCSIAFAAALASYFTVAMVSTEDLWGAGRSYSLGVAIGAALILAMGLVQFLIRSASTVFRLFPWLVFGTIAATLLCVVRWSTDFVGFLLALAVVSVFEVLLIMYMARSTLSGYTAAASAFALSCGAIRLGIWLGNALAITYQGLANPKDWTTPTLLMFAALLAGLLIPLVRQEYTINDLARSPQDESDWTSILDQVAQEYRLSTREKQIVGMLGRGYTAAAVADKLVISPNTVNTHVQHIYDKLGIHKRSELLDYLNRR